MRIGDISAELYQSITKAFSHREPQPEPHYDCEWCRDYGIVECYRENGQNHPIRSNDKLRVKREKRDCYFVACPCGFCEAGTYRGRPTDGSLKGAERWVKENVTGIVSLSGTYEKAKEEGFDNTVIDHAFKRLGIRKFKHANRWMCEPAA